MAAMPQSKFGKTTKKVKRARTHKHSYTINIYVAACNKVKTAIKQARNEEEKVGSKHENKNKANYIN